jgi:hypothetical protein
VPRLVLLEDDGRELFAGRVSRENVERVAGFLRTNMGTLKAISDARSAVAAFLEAMDPLARLLAPKPPKRRLPSPGARPRGPRRRA